MKVSQHIIKQQVAQEVKYPRSIAITPELLRVAWTSNGKYRQVHNGKLITQLCDFWQGQIGGRGNVEIARAYMDKNSLRRVNHAEKTTHLLTEEELAGTNDTDLEIGRLIIELRVVGLSDEVSPAMAILLSPEGEEIAFGENVSICSNFTIFSAERLHTTYSKAKSSFQDMMPEIEKFMCNTERNLDIDIKEIEALKKIEVSRPQFEQFVGNQYMQIERYNHRKVTRTMNLLQENEKQLFVNGKQLSRIAIEADRPSHEVYAWRGDATTAWNIVNYGTEQIKVERDTDFANVLPFNRNWVELVKTQFALN